jgi:hypothetical protein
LGFGPVDFQKTEDNLLKHSFPSGVENEMEFSEGVDDIRRLDHNKKGAANGNK